ncbi:MAG: Lrp/AsnC family transcriptional regulator, partial [Saprospiraceae bacterium]|nr:Lrp/AsnC family transcriptional regulator [Saprospiraceae bacterium]
RILEILQEDSRKTIREISQELNLTTTPVFERIKKLEKAGIIKQYVALLDTRKLGRKLHAFIDISIKDHSKAAIDSFVEEIISHPEVQACYHITGVSDFLLKIILEDVEQYNEFVLNKLSTVPNIGKVETRFSLSTRKDTHMIRI